MNRAQPVTCFSIHLPKSMIDIYLRSMPESDTWLSSITPTA